MASKSFDVAIIGGGPGGYVAGIRCGQLGLQSVVIEREHLGGVCLNWGCIPSKALIHAANVVHELHNFEKFGIRAKGLEINASELMAWKDGIIKKQRGGIKSLLDANKSQHLVGDATLTSANTLKVSSGNGGAGEEIRFKKLIIATGASVIELPTFPFDDQLVGYARHGVAYDPIPEKLVIIGGGVIGCELGLVYAKLGAKVTIVEMLPSILTGMDPDLVKPVLKTMSNVGIDVLTQAKALGFEKQGHKGLVKVEVGGGVRTIEADKILVAVGFKPNVKNLGLEQVGVKTDARGWIQINELCQTNLPHIYAIGDVTGAPLLAHRASKMGEVAAEVIAGHPAAYDVRAMPLGVFTDPEVAQAGWTEAEAKEKGHEVSVGNFPLSALGRAAAMNAPNGMFKVVIDKKSDVILGIGIAAPGACDMIAEACLALEMGALAEDLGLTVHAHPTLAEGLMEAAKAAKGEAIHMLNRKPRPAREAAAAHSA